jgi:hypothetical protein
MSKDYVFHPGTPHAPDVEPRTFTIATTENDTMNISERVSAPLTIDPVSIASSAMLCELSISVWTGRKMDKKASAEVIAANNAGHGAVNVHKKLLGNCHELQAIQKLASSTRNLHYSMTMPWSDMGLRLIPTAQYFKYENIMTGLQNEFVKLQELFCDAYDWETTQAQSTLGSLFNQAEYPTVDSIRRKFKFRLATMPVPLSGDWRLDIGNEAMEEVRTQYEGYIVTQVQTAMDDLWRRLFQPLDNMSKRLDYASKEDKKIFKDSLVGNVLDMVELLKTCNITGDIQMEAARTKLEDALRGVTADGLREDAYLRSETKRTVDEVIRSLPSLDF